MNLTVSNTDVTRMCELLGIPEAPRVTAGVALTIQFFQKNVKVDPFDWVDYIRGIDFHKQVRCELLPTGLQLSQHKSAGKGREKPFVYYTKPGTSQFRTGTSFTDSSYQLFEVSAGIKALISTASGIKFHTADRVSRLGGGVQYILSSRDAQRLQKLRE